MAWPASQVIPPSDLRNRSSSWKSRPLRAAACHSEPTRARSSGWISCIKSAPSRSAARIPAKVANRSLTKRQVPVRSVRMIPTGAATSVRWARSSAYRDAATAEDRLTEGGQPCSEPSAPRRAPKDAPLGAPRHCPSRSMAFETHGQTCNGTRVASRRRRRHHPLVRGDRGLPIEAVRIWAMEESLR